MSNRQLNSERFWIERRFRFSSVILSEASLRAHTGKRRLRQERARAGGLYDARPKSRVRETRKGKKRRVSQRFRVPQNL
jgi:hypothetical protein